MKNKFEALTAFQSWPEDWQRLCAEYWAAVAMREGVKPAPVEMQAVAVDEPSITSAKPRKRQKASSARRWTAKELKWLVLCTDQADTQAAGIRDFLQRYKDRNFGACEQQLRQIKNGKKTVYK